MGTEGGEGEADEESKKFKIKGKKSHRKQHQSLLWSLECAQKVTFLERIRLYTHLSLTWWGKPGQRRVSESLLLFNSTTQHTVNAALGYLMD